MSLRGGCHRNDWLASLVIWSDESGNLPPAQVAAFVDVQPHRQATEEVANRTGQAWVGDNATLASDGKTLVSADSLRQYRPPTFKPNLGVTLANFESRWLPQGTWQTNGHLTVVP